MTKSEEKDTGSTAEDLRVSAMIMFGIAPGLVCFGAILGLALAGELFFIMLGVSSLVGFIGVGMFAASFMLREPLPAPKQRRNSSGMLSSVVTGAVSLIVF